MLNRGVYSRNVISLGPGSSGLLTHTHRPVTALPDVLSVDERLSDGKSLVFLTLVCPPTAGTVFHPQWRQPGTFSKPTVSRSSQNFYKHLSGWDFAIELYSNSVEFPVSSSEQAHSESASNGIICCLFQCPAHWLWLLGCHWKRYFRKGNNVVSFRPSLHHYMCILLSVVSVLSAIQIKYSLVVTNGFQRSC